MRGSHYRRDGVLAARWHQKMGKLLHIAAWFVIPVVGLLFLQWPLRDLMQGYSTQANDAAQVLFALYVACALTAATRRDTHLRAHLTDHRAQPEGRSTMPSLRTFLLVAWAALLLVASFASVLQSALGMEHFPETGNPGYFLIRMALWLLALLVVAEAVLERFAPRR